MNFERKRSSDEQLKLLDAVLPVDFELSTVQKLCAGDATTSNRIIQGDNLEVLSYLATVNPASVRCVYLDPPYNNGESYKHYFDSMGHDEWLSAVTERIRLVKDLLRNDGSLWISIDDSELHYLKVSCDSVFGRDNFVGTIIWERRTTSENRRAISRKHEYLLIYAKDAKAWAKARNSMPISDQIKSRYKNPDADPRGPWQSISANVQDGHATASQFYEFRAPSGKVHHLPNGRCWVYTKEKMAKEVAKNNIWFGKNGNGVPRIKSFISDRSEGVAPDSLWRAEEVGTTAEAKKELIALFGEKPLFDTPKPERLIERILAISTNPGDLVLDAYLGSGTTAAVAHKMKRTYIGIENGAHARTHCAARLKAVIDGEKGGVSDKHLWTGGGGFAFQTLKRAGKKSGER